MKLTSAALLAASAASVAAARPANPRSNYVKGAQGEVAVPGEAAAHGQPEARGPRTEVVFDLDKAGADDAEDAVLEFVPSPALDDEPRRARHRHHHEDSDDDASDGESDSDDDDDHFRRPHPHHPSHDFNDDEDDHERNRPPHHRFHPHAEEEGEHRPAFGGRRHRGPPPMWVRVKHFFGFFRAEGEGCKGKMMGGERFEGRRRFREVDADEHRLRHSPHAEGDAPAVDLSAFNHTLPPHFPGGNDTHGNHTRPPPPHHPPHHPPPGCPHPPPPPPPHCRPPPPPPPPKGCPPPPPPGSSHDDWHKWHKEQPKECLPPPPPPPPPGCPPPPPPPPKGCPPPPHFPPHRGPPGPPPHHRDGDEEEHGAFRGFRAGGRGRFHAKGHGRHHDRHGRKLHGFQPLMFIVAVFQLVAGVAILRAVFVRVRALVRARKEGAIVLGEDAEADEKAVLRARDVEVVVVEHK